ncbi:hypothetical protein C2S53_002527 [Perilla frutescens var. hirtella]|uniref:Uncharacterized protein n=1 Tax=Perilla frutescens var. hirtella TaxID=608512 RepID=A0AAD4IQS6_PERFH|nr:hypothetical protein C2S53_002527 [Perilla frutescens var. hirtella]
MGALIVYLELLVRLEKLKEQLTPQEVHLMQARNSLANRDFVGGLCIGSLAAWLATKRLPRMPRTAISAGAGAFSGLLLLAKSHESTVDYLVSLQGTRIQAELAHIMLKKYQNDPWVRTRVYKYFYPEVVYGDASVDWPVYRWRYRNSFVDPVALQSTPNSEETETDSNENDVKKTSTETKQAYMNAGECDDDVESPFDLVLRHPESAEDGPQAQANNAPRSLPRRQSRREKRLRRRRRQHQQEESEF